MFHQFHKRFLPTPGSRDCDSDRKFQFDFILNHQMHLPQQIRTFLFDKLPRRHIHNKYNKFISAITGQNITFTKTAAQPVGKFLNPLVSCLLPKAIIDLFKIININKQKRLKKSYTYPCTLVIPASLYAARPLSTSSCLMSLKMMLSMPASAKALAMLNPMP